VKQGGSTIFFFKPEHQELIEPVENVICSICSQHFGLDREQVEIFYIDTADVKTMIQSWGNLDLYPCFLNLDSKLAVLLVSGIEKDQVEACCNTLENLLLMYVKM
jgi:hypothetical protein